MFKNLINIFNKREKLQLLGLFVLMLVTGAVEAIGVGIIFPFMALLTNTNLIHENYYLSSLYNYFSFTSVQNFLIFLSTALIGVILLKNLFFAVSHFIQQHFLAIKRVQVINVMLKGYLHEPYRFHLKNNSVILWRNLTMVDSLFTGLLKPFFSIVSEAIIVLFIFSVMIKANAKVTLIASIIIIVPSYLVHIVFSSRLKKLGRDQFNLTGSSSKLLFEALGGVKDILLYRKHDYFTHSYRSEALSLAKVRRDIVVIGTLPRLVLEPVVTAAILGSVIILLFVQKQTLIAMIPTLSLLATASFRLMVSFNKIIVAVQQLKTYDVLKDSICLDLIKFKQREETEDEVRAERDEKNIKKELDKSIQVENVSFRYDSDSKYVLRDISIDINKGDSVAFVGASGAGKSTLVDILLGLLKPDKGAILFDGKDINETLNSATSLVGYVPQEIFLSDDTLKRNIAFGVAEQDIDDAALSRALELAQLEDVITELPEGLDTLIGEKGTRLSGGQRQRIGIARALYLEPDIIIMDEATSALDGETESLFSLALDRLSQKKTLVIIAHRFSTIKKCDRIYFLEDGRITDCGTFSGLYKKNEAFRRMARGQTSSQELME